MTIAYPERWFIEVSRSCNLHCVMCRESNEKYSRMLMDVSLLDKLSPFLKEAEAILPYGWGEPLMHPKFADILRKIHGINPNAHIAFNTNGQMITPSLAETLIEAKVTTVCFSVDSVTPSRYETIRRGAKFDRLIEAIKTLNRSKREKGSLLPQLFMETVLMQQNIGELEEIADFLKRYGFCGVILEEVRQSPIDKETLKKLKINSRKKHRKTLKSFGKKLAENNLFLMGPIGTPYRQPAKGGSTSEPIKPYPSIEQLSYHPERLSLCQQPWINVFVSHDGNCYPCCMNSAFQIGNLFDTSFDELWHGAKISAIRDNFVRKKFTLHCKQCIKESRHLC